MESVFFAKPGEQGLNETSATKLAAVASNLKTKYEAILSNMSFLNVQIDVVGSNGTRIDSEYGMSPETLNTVKDICHRCGVLNGFISYLREASKAVEQNRFEANDYDFDAWLIEQGIEKPESPRYVSKITPVNFNDMIDEMNIKERAEYLALEAKAAQLGKLIHPSGTFDDARNEMWLHIAKPTAVQGKGRDMVVYYYTPSVDRDDVNRLFEELQKQYQNYESSLNHIKSDLRKKMDARNAELNAKRQVELQEQTKAMQAYNNKIAELTIQYNQWQADKVSEASKVKIAIPEQYQELLHELYEIGK